MNRVLTALLFGAAFVGALVATAYADAHVTTVVDQATLQGDAAGAFTTHPMTVTACASYTVELRSKLTPAAQVGEDAIGFEIWNTTGDVELTDTPVGQRIWHGPSQKYYVASMRDQMDPNIEWIRFQVPCTAKSPDYQLRIFNYVDGATNEHSVIQGVQIGSEG